MSERLEYDFVAVGSGMAGLSAGARAAEQGARVLVVEKQDAIGGSSSLSGGVLWTLQSLRKLTYNTDGRPELGAIVIDGYPAALEWLRGRGVAMSGAMPVLNGQGYQIDILSHLRDCVTTIEAAGGHIALSSTVKELVRDGDGGVAGAVVSHADGDIEVSCPWTLLATGGYQGDPELRARYIHPNGRDMRLRSNLASDGAGLRLGLAAGGAFDGDNPGFYGHLVVASPSWGEPRLFTALTQYHSDHGLLINEQGERFCDESLGDHTNTYATVTQSGARAVLIWDERVQQEVVLRPFLKISPIADRMEIARTWGGEGGVMASLSDLAAFADSHGFDAARTLETLQDYNRALECRWEQLKPARTENYEPLDRPPYYVLIVYPAITYTFGGLTIDPATRVLRPGGDPVGGLLAAGADAGDVYRVGYAGGLAQAVTLGLKAAATAGF